MNGRPVLSIPKTTVEKILDIISVLLIVSTLLYLFYIWNDLPEQIPTHFNAVGEADNWGGKGFVWMMPIVGLLLFVMVSLVGKYPHIFNYPVTITEENAPRIYLESRRMLVIVNFEMVLFFSLISLEIVRVAFEKEGFGVWLILIFLFIIFSTIGISLYRLFKMR